MKIKQYHNQHDAVAFLAYRQTTSEPGNLGCWDNGREEALTVSTVKSGFVDEVLKETLQKR